MTSIAAALFIGLLIGFTIGWRAASGLKVVQCQPMTIRVAFRDPDLDAAVRGDA